MYDVYGVYAATHEEACLIAGCDTPSMIADEMQALEDEATLGILLYSDREEIGAPLRKSVYEVYPKCRLAGAPNEFPFADDIPF